RVRRRDARSQRRGRARRPDRSRRTRRERPASRGQGRARPEPRLRVRSALVRGADPTRSARPRDRGQRCAPGRRGDRDRGCAGTGRAGSERALTIAILLLALGLALIVLELLFPTFGALGITAALCIIGAVAVAFAQETRSGVWMLVASALCVPL